MGRVGKKKKKQVVQTVSYGNQPRSSDLYLVLWLAVYIWASLVAQLVKNLPAMQETQVWFLGQEDPLEKEMATHYSTLAWEIPWTEELDRLQSIGLQRFGHNWTDRQASLIAQLVKNLPAMQETLVRFLGWEDPLEKEIATHSSILAWEIPWTEEPGGLPSMGSQRVGHDWVTEHAYLLSRNVLEVNWIIKII